MPPVYRSGMPCSSSNNTPFILQDTDQTLQKLLAPSARGNQCSPGAPTGHLSISGCGYTSIQTTKSSCPAVMSYLSLSVLNMAQKIRLVNAMVFPVVMYGCESWTIKKAERQRIDPFEVWCWRRLLRVPRTARTSNQSILKEISPGCSLEGLMLKLKLQYFGHLMRRADSLEKTLMLEGLWAVGERNDRG